MLPPALADSGRGPTEGSRRSRASLPSVHRSGGLVQVAVVDKRLRIGLAGGLVRGFQDRADGARRDAAVDRVAGDRRVVQGAGRGLIEVEELLESRNAGRPVLARRLQAAQGGADHADDGAAVAARAFGIASQAFGI